MRPFPMGICLAALSLAACTNVSDSAGVSKAEQSIVANCRRWDVMAELAADPDAATTAAHDRLVRRAKDMEASAFRLHGAARELAIREIAQTKIEAEAVYDVAGKAEVAKRCWRDLALIKRRNREIEAARATAALQKIGADLRATGEAMMNRPVPVVSQPPAAPEPLASSGLSDFYTVQHSPIRLFTPDGPIIGESTRIGSTPPPTTIIVPVPIR